jgi:outer membrane protein
MRRADSLCIAVAAAALLAAPAAAQTPDTAAVRGVTLAEAVRLAEEVQPRVVQAEGALRNADARIRTARGAYLPSLSLSTRASQSYSGVQSSRTDPNTGLPVTGSTSGSVSTSLNASVDLFTGFRRGAETRAARATSEAAEASLVDARFQQALATTNQFFDALAARQLLAVREQSVRRAEQQLAVSVNRLAAGSATRSDSLRSRVTLGTAQLQLLQAQAQLADAEANLGRLVGAQVRVRALDDSTFYQRNDVIDTAAVRRDAEARAPQVRAARADVVAAAAGVRSARAAYWPSLTLSGDVGLSGSKSNNYDFYDNRGVSLALSWPIFNRWQREQNIASQEVQADIAEAQAGETARLVTASVTGQLAELEAARARIGITTLSVTAATEDLRVQQERYRLGASTIVDILTSQEALNQAEVDAVNARFDYLRAKAQIEALIGRSL